MLLNLRKAAARASALSADDFVRSTAVSIAFQHADIRWGDCSDEDEDDYDEWDGEEWTGDGRVRWSRWDGPGDDGGRGEREGRKGRGGGTDGDEGCYVV